MSRAMLLLSVIVCSLSVVVSQSTTSTDHNTLTVNHCTTDQHIDPLRRQLSYITEQQQQFQRQLLVTFDKLLSKLEAIGICRDILVQQNVDGSRFFDRTWSEFKAGFGNTSGNYWLGNEQLHRLTQSGKYKLRFDLQSLGSGDWYWAEYDMFTVGDESTGYMLTVGGFNGTVLQDVFGYQNAMKFSTMDQDNDLYNQGHCARQMGGGFWYYNCFYCKVNGAGENFKWFYMGDSADFRLRTSRMWLVCR